MDRTIINIVSLVIGGAGIFAALTDYNVPDLLDDYWGRNPFTTKADHIRRRNSVLFATLAVVAIALQALAEVLGDALPDRSYGTSTYGVLLVGALLLTWLLVFMLAKLGRLLARREWLPEVIDSQRKSFEAAIEVILNDGWRHDQLAVKGPRPVKWCMKPSAPTSSFLLSRP
ncbi:MAG: hypothetical protein Q7V53_03420 [Caldisericota bacterium]|nr:hypothetical protein [Caldisericota bacterium]